VHFEHLHAFVGPTLVYIVTFSAESRNFDLESWEKYFPKYLRTVKSGENLLNNP